MSKITPFLFFIILLVSTMPLPQAEALGIGPPSIEIDLIINGSNSTTFYFDSEGVEGKLVIGKENLPFRIEPLSVNMSKEDNYRPVELTFYGNETLEPGVYEGKVTFVAYTGGFVAVGIKIRTKITLLEASLELHHEVKQEALIEEESEEEPEAETEPESEEEPETIADEEEPKIEFEREPENESQENSGNPYVTGGLAIVAIVVLGLIGIWWNRR